MLLNTFIYCAVNMKGNVQNFTVCLAICVSPWLTQPLTTSYCARVSPSMTNRMVDSARSVLNSYLPDVYIYTDVARGGGRDRLIYCLIVAIFRRIMNHISLPKHFAHPSWEAGAAINRTYNSGSVMSHDVAWSSYVSVKKWQWRVGWLNRKS